MTRGQALYHGICIALGLDPDGWGVRATVAREAGIHAGVLGQWAAGTKDPQRADEDRLRRRYSIDLIGLHHGGWDFEVVPQPQ